MKATTLMRDPLAADLSELTEAQLEALARDLVRTIVREHDGFEGGLSEERGLQALYAISRVAAINFDVATVAFVALDLESIGAATMLLHIGSAIKRGETEGWAAKRVAELDEQLWSWTRQLKENFHSGDAESPTYRAKIMARSETFLTDKSK